jgi:threonine aldolase
MIDLRSNTCSRPTPEMRAAMANADVGDDLYGDDPTVKALDRATAELLGKQNAVYVPTGIMTNQVGMHLVQAVAGEDHREAALTLTAEGTKALAEAAPLWERAQATIERAMDGGEAAPSADFAEGAIAVFLSPHPSPLTLSGHWARR